MRLVRALWWSTAVLAAYAAVLGLTTALALAELAPSHGQGMASTVGAARGPLAEGAATAPTGDASMRGGHAAAAARPRVQRPAAGSGTPTASATRADTASVSTAAAAPAPPAPPAVPSPATAAASDAASPATGDALRGARAWLEEAAAEASVRAWLDAHHPDLKPATRAAIAAAVAQEAARRGLDPWLLVSVIKVESDFNPEEVGSAGEIGLMQVLPDTARLVARSVFGLTAFDPALLFDPMWNIRIAAAFLADRLRAFRGDVAMALAAYNAGDGVKQPTAYARAVLGWYGRLRPR
ncbi:MAG: lytic transglycosylase domain-containing protein [Firmicutes bacterium]|nr:lytic transglycosylase domain-containing protein [Bacillota bacterium]